MPRVGSKQSIGAGVGGHPAGDRHLLLVSAGKPLHLALRACVDLEARDRPIDPLALQPLVERSPGGGARAEGKRDVLLYRALHQQRLGAVSGNVDEPGPDGVGGMRELHCLPFHLDRAAARPGRAGKDVEQLVLPLPFEGNDAQHLAGKQVEGNILELASRTRRFLTRSRGTAPAPPRACSGAVRRASASLGARPARRASAR